MAAFTPDQQKFIDFVFRTLNNRIADVHGGIYRTRREVIALAVLLSRKGIDITAEELEAAAKELEAGHQVHGPRFQGATRRRAYLADAARRRHPPGGNEPMASRRRGPVLMAAIYAG